MLKGGVLLIGSLLWEESEMRVKWRNDNLVLDEKLLVNAPIRYGRISSSRDETYTMIMSSECKSKNKIGKALFVPFINEKMSIEGVFNQSKKMIDAEHNGNKNLNRLNWGWGCIGIILNPSLINDKTKCDLSQNLLIIWKDNYGKGFNPEHYKVCNETPIISKDGVLNIDWDENLNDYDFFVATATKVNVDAYPLYNDIAKIMIDNNYTEYFEENVDNSIYTFQDEKIKQILKEHENVE